MIQLVILTGVYGAGKSLAAQAFEESGYYVTDNVPISVVEKYFEEIKKDPVKFAKVALTVDRNVALETLKLAQKHKEFDIKFVGLTCSLSVLNERFRLSRKLHPMQSKGFSLEKSIRTDLQEIRSLTDYFDVYIDTSKLTKNEFRNQIYDACIGSKHKFAVSFYSFGYKISVPQDIETVFDVRLLPNPYWEPHLKHLTGLDQEVKDYVLKAEETKEYLKHVTAYLDFYFSELKKAGRNHASIGFACSGGQHRSVAIAEYFAKYYSKKYVTAVAHKDLPKK